MNKITFSYDDVDDFVAAQKKLGVDCEWDGWDIVFFRPNPNGFSEMNGSFKKVWGIKYIVSPSNEGTWTVPTRYVKSI